MTKGRCGSQQGTRTPSSSGSRTAKLSLGIHRADSWDSHTAVLTRLSGSAEQTVSGVWSVAVWLELTCPKRWLISPPFSRQSHRITAEECGFRSDVTACTVWPTVCEP